MEIPGKTGLETIDEMIDNISRNLHCARRFRAFIHQHPSTHASFLLRQLPETNSLEMSTGLRRRGRAGQTNPLAALEELRRRIRTRHYSYRTERTYADWVQRFLTYLAKRQNAPHPRLDSDAVRDYLTHLAVRQRVSASSQNQALSAIQFICREMLSS